MAQTKKPTKAEVAEAKKHFNEAQTHYRLQEYQAALDEFQQAYKLSQKAGLLFNIAQCYRQMQQYPEAIQGFQAFIHDDPESSYRAEAEKNISELQALLAQQKLAEQQRLEASQEKPKEQSKRRPLLLSLFGVAAGAGVASAVSGGLFVAGFSDFKDASTTNIDADLLQDDFQKLQRRALLADAFFGLAVLSAGTGVVFHLISPSPKETTAAISLSPLSGGLQVGLGVSY